MLPRFMQMLRRTHADAAEKRENSLICADERPKTPNGTEAQTKRVIVLPRMNYGPRLLATELLVIEATFAGVCLHSSTFASAKKKILHKEFAGGVSKQRRL